jgi:hypothetical protein
MVYMDLRPCRRGGYRNRLFSSNLNHDNDGQVKQRVILVKTNLRTESEYPGIALEGSS